MNQRQSIIEPDENQDLLKLYKTLNQVQSDTRIEMNKQGKNSKSKSGMTYDYIVLGGGAAGLVSAKLARGLGKSVVIIEKKNLGGECTWTGCVPSKALIHAAHQVNSARKACADNFTANDGGIINGKQVMAYVQDKVQKVYATHTPEKIQEHGIDVVVGNPRFIDAHTIQVDDSTYTASKILIGTGSSPFVPPIKGLDTVEHLTNQTIFNLETLPQSLAIVGGGPIGLELGCAFFKLGVDITIIERGQTILSHDDQELTSLLLEQVKKSGIKMLTQTSVDAAAKSERGVNVSCTQNDKPLFVEAEKLLLAVGRRPNIDGLGLDEIGVATTKRGVTVDAYMRTSVPHIYAAGDVAGPYQFSHMAERQAIVATKNAFLPLKQKIDYTGACWVTFAGPELATSGLTEIQAREQFGDNYTVYKVVYDTIDRPVIDDTGDGIAKFVCDLKGRILGAHILGHRAGELMHEVHVARTLGQTLAELDSVIHAYPTYSDVVKKAARLCYIDVLKRKWYIKLIRYFFGGNKPT